MADIELDNLIVRDFTKVSSEVFKQAVESGEIGENDINFTAYCPPSLWLFYSHWSDHEIDDMSWSCADTFSWHPSDPYIAGYEKLVNAITGAEQKTDTIGDITITYYQKGDNGLKVCLPDQESNLVALYEATGVAWYYILDTVNEQFKLPRTKWGFTGLRDSVGGYVAPGLPNITGEVGQIDFSGSRSFSGAFTDIASPSGDTGATHAGGTRTTVGFDASLSNPTYQDGATVQPPATQMYLYFYVGNFEQDAVEQTAGLNAELFNGKADVDLNNINPSDSAKAMIVGWGMPDYDSGVSISTSVGGTFTVPTDCCLFGRAGGNSRIGVNKDNSSGANLLYLESAGSDTATDHAFVAKGTKLHIAYRNGSYTTLIYYPLKGVN